MIVGIFYYNFKSTQEIVTDKDVEFYITDIKHQDNIIFITVDIVNKSTFHLVSNHMFIDKFDSENKQLNDDEKSIEGVTRSIVKPFSRESAISSEATQRSIDEQPIGITVNELEGKFSNIPANSTVKIRMEYQHETNDSEIGRASCRE